MLLQSVNVLSNRNENNSQDFPLIRYRFDDKLYGNLNNSLVVVFDDVLNLIVIEKIQKYEFSTFLLRLCFYSTAVISYLLSRSVEGTLWTDLRNDEKHVNDVHFRNVDVDAAERRRYDDPGAM